MENAIIAIEVHELFKALDKEIQVFVGDIQSKIINKYINQSIIYSITLQPKDKPEWNLLKELLVREERANNISDTLRFFTSTINNYLNALIPQFSIIDNQYEIINRKKLQLDIDNNTLYIKVITKEDWDSILLNNRDIREFDGYIPEKLR